MQLIKGKTSNQLMREYRVIRREYRVIRKEFWGRHLWARGYFVATTGIELQGAVPRVSE